MMPWRAYGAKGVGGFANNHRINRGAYGADRTQRGLTGFWGHHGIAVQGSKPLLRHSVHDPLVMVWWMDKMDLLRICLRRFPPLQIAKTRILERIEHGAQTRRAFRVAGTGIVFGANRMVIEQCCHDQQSYDVVFS